MALNRLFWPPPELPGPFVESCGVRTTKSVKLRFNVGSRAMAESLTVVATPVFDGEICEPVTPTIITPSSCRGRSDKVKSTRRFCPSETKRLLLSCGAYPIRRTDTV
jgi:hypothetical protein